MACMRDGFEQDKLLDNRFLTVSPLNHGSFGLVFCAKDNVTGDDVAVKCITKPNAVQSTPACPAAFATDEHSEELSIHSKLPHHPNIVNLIHHFETEHHQYMVLELCSNGDLYEAIRVGRGPLETEHVRDFMLQLVDAIDHMHSHGVYHRDIKPENIFLTSTGLMKVGDFGLATTDLWSTEFAVGSDRYMAPEQFDYSSSYGYGYSPAAADIWAIGIVLLNVLFQRNPFATPTDKDPLFKDFAADRQSLFDVFPNMSQDTYNVLRHSLALDPGNRSLGAVREAILSAVSFTVDDESLDEFCTEQFDLVPVATHARQPLRTPSITSPPPGDSFPWSSALLKTPQKQERQLSTIRDDEPDMFPGSVKSEWHYVDTDEASLNSNVDSGLGMSYKSNNSTKSSLAAKRGVNFVGSLPISFTRPNAAFNPYKSNGFSKSWSDLYDEEEELAQEGRSSLELGLDISRVSTAKPSTPQLAAIVEDGRGSVTPRQGLAEIDGNARSSGTATPRKAEDKVADPPKRSSSILDKWSALGNFRRARQEAASSPAPVPAPAPARVPVSAPAPIPAPAPVTPTPARSKYTDAIANFTPFSSSKRQKSQSKSRERSASSSWRQGSPSPARVRSSSSSGNKAWDRNNQRERSPTHPPVPAIPETWARNSNWREPKHAAAVPAKPTYTTQQPHGPSSVPRHLQQHSFMNNAKMVSGPQQRKPHPQPQQANDKKDFLSSEIVTEGDDLDDLEWVGGWRDFHL